MKRGWKIFIGIILFLIFAALVIFYLYKKGAFNPYLYEQYISKQVDDQCNTPFERQVKLDFSFCENELVDFSERYKEIEPYILEKDIDSIQNSVNKNLLSYKELTLFYLYRIKKYDDDYNSIIQLNPDALKIAEKCDIGKKELQIIPKLYGIPLLLKDNIATGDNMSNTAGALAMKDEKSPRDAFVVKKLRENGAIILGKTNLSEWANFMTNESRNGFSALGGFTHNAYGRFDVGGSSSGSAVSLSMNFAAVTIGTETSGSLIYPSAQNSVFVLKPSFGMVSRDLIIPISDAYDTAGPMAKNAMDLAFLFDAMLGYDETNSDKYLLDINKFKIKSFQQTYLQEKDYEGMKVAFIKTPYLRIGDKKFIKDFKRKFIEMGIECIDIDYPEIDMNFDSMYSILLHGFKVGLSDYLGQTGSTMNLEKILKFNEENKEKAAPFGYSILTAAYEDTLTDEEYFDLVKISREKVKEAIDELLEKNAVDFLVCLSNHFSHIYASAGYPALNMPAGYRASGEPQGITIIGGYLSDGDLLQFAYNFEKKFPIRKRPE